MKSNQASWCALWAGLLLVGGPAQFADGAAPPDDLDVRYGDGRVSVAARGVPLDAVVREISERAGLRLVQHAALDRPVTVDIRDEPLPDALNVLLGDVSYQLFQVVPEGDRPGHDTAIPDALWIFSKGSVEEQAAADYLETVILRGGPADRREAIRVLRQVGSEHAVRALSLALGDDDPRIRDAALDALAAIGGDQALAAIASVSMDDDPVARARATQALAMSGGPSSLAYLDLALRDESPAVRTAAIESLGAIGDERSIEVLRQALRDPDPSVREHALEVIDNINDDAAFRVLFPPQ